MSDSSDLHAPDPIAEANRRIRAYVAGLPGGRITPEDRAAYDALVDEFMAAVRDRDDARERSGPVAA